MSMLSEVSPLSAAGTQEARRLLREANTAANSTKSTRKLLHRVRSKLLAPKSDVTCSTLTDYVDRSDRPSLDVLQTLLETLESQVGIEKFQSTLRRLLIVAAKHGHTEVLEHLLTTGADVNHSHGEALQEAVLFGHISCVEALMQRALSADAIQRALITTDFIELDQAHSIVPLLLDSNLPRAVLDYLRLKMYASSPDDFDSDILAMLVAATHRSTLRGSVDMIEDSADLHTYFEVQRQVRPFRLRSAPFSMLFKASESSLQITLRQPKRSTFGDDTIKSSENLILRLLERYIKGCSAREGVGNQWPISTINLLLDRMSTGAGQHSEYTRCIILAVNFQQAIVFARLLHHSALSITTLRSLSFIPVIKNDDMIFALLEYLNQHSMTTEIYLEIVRPLFVLACETQLLPRAVHICSRSRVPIPITTVLRYLKVAIAYDENIQHISNLFKVAKVEQNDVHLLWNYVLATPKFSTNAARMLLQAGVSNHEVSKSLLRGVHVNEKISNLFMMINEWKTPKTLDLRNSFNYRTRRQNTVERSVTADSHYDYFPTLATALQFGIESQNLELCQMLLERGAPLVSAQNSLLDRAVFCGIKHPSIHQDKILDLVLSTEMERSDSQGILDFALLQAVRYLRHQIVADLINQGASTLAYGHECWHLAFHHPGSELLLRPLVTSVRGRDELSQYFQAIFTSFNSDHGAWMTLSSQMYQAGFVDSNSYQWLFQVLCHRNRNTTQDLERLIEYGAFESPALDQCLEQCWQSGNLPMFRILTEKGISQRGAESTLESILRDCAASTRISCWTDGNLFGKPRVDMMLGAISSLLRMNMSKQYLNPALRRVALLSNEPAPLRISVLTALLEKGARFSENDGLALAHCFLVNSEFFTQKINASRPPLKARQEALRLIINFPSDMDEPAPSHRSHALLRMLQSSDLIARITLTDRQIMQITSVFLSPDSNTPTTLIHSFYTWLRTQSSTGVGSKQYCSALEIKLNSIIEGLACTKNMSTSFIERVIAVLAWIRPAYDFTVRSAQHFSCFYVPIESMSRLLIASSKSGLVPLVGALIEAGVSTNVFDANGKSVMSWAVTENKPEIVKFLINAGANSDDGSLHEATCHQHHAIMQLLLQSGHSREWLSASHDNMTPLLAFVHFDHTRSSANDFRQTMTTLTETRPITTSDCWDVKSAVEAALYTAHAFKLILALLPWLKLCFDTAPQILQAPISKGALRYSVLSLVDLWSCSVLTRSEKNSLVLSLQGVGFDEIFYTTEGDQPGNAVNVPEAVLRAEQLRKRQLAFRTKECCIHGDKVEVEDDVHAGLAPTCATTHAWNDDIVCTDCLKQYLETRMFPHDDMNIKYKFPSTRIPCWAPKCPTIELPHNVLQKYCDPEIFRLYDIALCQAFLREGKSLVKCATTDCPGAHWYDERDEHEDLKIFFCEVCFQNTCTECNDLYEKHYNEPCPAGEEARKSERIKEEEKLSENALKLEKRCPKCKLLYQRYHGCDHIICGKNVYDNRVDKGCRFEFCNVCFGAWPGGHTRDCAHRS